MASERVTIFLSKGSGGSQLTVELEGFSTSKEAISIHQITTNAKFKTDQETMPFNLGFQYTFDQIAQYFLVTKLYTTGTVMINNVSTTLLSYAFVPIIGVKGNSVSIANGDTTPALADHTDFGSVAAASGTVVRTFTIENTGRKALTLGGTPKVAVSGTHAANFTLTTAPATTVAPNGTTTFQITFDPSATGARVATLSIANDDFDSNPFTFAITGTGT
ncbi:MAG: choice-of-anchor D domain-containing protein [Acinetobacter sp.]|nr:choice-of-anchor D domain-containing protein [Acinetobacter sp.]